MMKSRIGSRLALSFAIIVLLMLLGSTIGVWQFFAVREQVNRLEQVNREAIAILRINNRVLRLKDELQRLINEQDAASFAEQAMKLRDSISTNVEQAIEILNSSEVRDEEGRYSTQLGQLVNIAALSSEVDLMIELAEAGEWSAVELRLDNQVRETSLITQDLIREIDNIVSEEQRLAQRNKSLARRQAFVAISITSLLSLLVAVGLAILVTRSIAQPLALLDAGAKALARREFDHRVIVTGDDELANLSRIFNDAASQLADLYNDLAEMARQRTEELHHRYLQIETSIAVGNSITSILDLDGLLNEVVELIRERYGYYFVGVFLLDESGEFVTARAGTGEVGRTLSQQKFQLKIDQEDIVSWVAKYRRPAHIDDVADESNYTQLDIVPHTRSELALPLIMGGATLGVLDIQSDVVMAFPLDDLPVLQSLADQVAIAIQNASLYQREKFRRRLAETLQRAGRAISSTLELEEVLDLILEHLAKLVPYDRAAVMLQDHGQLEIVAARGFPDDVEPLQIRVSIKENDVFQQIHQTQQPLSIADVSQRGDWQYVEGLPAARTWLGVPLIRFDTVIGMVSLTREFSQAYTNDEVTLAATFAGHAAFALENARLYEKLARLSQQLESMVKERTEALQAAYLQLEHLDRTKSDFINIAAHELRTPLTILQGYSKMLLGDSEIKENAYYLQLVSGIHSGAIRLHQVVNSMLDMAKIDSRDLDLYPEPLSVSYLINQVCQDFAETLLERNQTLNLAGINDLPAIEGDPIALPKVFYQLIVNAIKYTPDGGTITISGRNGNIDGEDSPTKGIDIIISDTGIGIDPEFHELIFTKFYQTGELALHSTGRTKFKGAGPGLGLAIARGIVEAHQGKLWVESPGHDENTCPGSRFHVLLPLRQSKVASQQIKSPTTSHKRAKALVEKQTE